VTVICLQLASGLTTPSLLGASQARFHPKQNERGIGRSGSRLAGAGETPVCLVVSSPRWHLVSSRFERAVAPIRSRVHELLIAAATNEIGTREKTAKNGANLSAIAPGRASTVAICDYRWGRAHQQCRRTSHSSRLMATHQFRVSESSGKSLWHGC